MKFLPSQLAYLLSQRQTRRNLTALLKYLLFLIVVILVYAEIFHLIMARIEGQDHSWLTGVYWTLTVMSTLGFGDITFTSDLGRFFSVVVLVSGIVLLLIVLPFAFIRFFYAPWLEAQIRLRAPREVPEGMEGHVILCHYDTIAEGLLERLPIHRIPYVLIEPDPTVAAQLHADDLSVVTGERDSRKTYVALQASRARAVVANVDDPSNTNITLTVREVDPEIPVVAIVEDEDSEDILELAGATHVLPLKKRLGEHLASRVNAGHAHAHLIGKFRDLQICEFPVHNTPLVGRSIRDTRLRQVTGVSIVGVWERGRFLPPQPDLVLSASSVPVVVGTAEQITELDTLLVIYDVNYNPVLVIGGGKVGRAAARALRAKGVSVHLVEKNPALQEALKGAADQVFLGDAADREVLRRAGLEKAPSVLLTTNDDAINIYLSVYCRRLNPDLRIVSRITHGRNLEAIHRAGADFVLSYTSLGVESILSLLLHRDPLLIGAGVDIFTVSVPQILVGKTLADSGIGARTGLNVLAIQDGEEILTNPPAESILPDGGTLLMLGTAEQRQQFVEAFG